MPASSFATEFKVLKHILESQNTTLRAELQAQREILDARLGSQDSKCNQMRWFIGILLAAGVLNVLATLFGWGAG